MAQVSLSFSHYRLPFVWVTNYRPHTRNKTLTRLLPGLLYHKLDLTFVLARSTTFRDTWKLKSYSTLPQYDQYQNTAVAIGSWEFLMCNQSGWWFDQCKAFGESNNYVPTYLYGEMKQFSQKTKTQNLYTLACMIYVLFTHLLMELTLSVYDSLKSFPRRYWCAGSL